MPVPGRQPKPPEQRRNRMPLTYEWINVANVRFDGAPPLPPTPKRPKLKAPDPPRRLATAGTALWVRSWELSSLEPDIEALLQLCEQTDERLALRVRVITDGDRHDRSALRDLDKQIADGLHRLAASMDDPLPSRWPPATRRWWNAVSTMPHCALWTEADWSFALDTAPIAARFHVGELRFAQELRRREATMGTTVDARRALRIRYIDPEPIDPADPSITAMADYRRKVQ